MTDGRMKVRAAMTGLALLAALGASGAAEAGEARQPVLLAQATDAAELAFWDSIKSSKDPAEYKAYLDTYPSGKFAALAKARMNSLQKQAAPAPKPAAKKKPAAKPAAAPAAPAAPGKAVVGKQYTTSRQAVVRQQPNADSPQASTIPAGQAVTVTADVPGTDWYRVSYSGQDVGYVHGGQLTGVATASAGPAPAAAASTPSLPGQAASGASSTAQGITTGAATAPALTQTAPAEKKIEYWTANSAGGQAPIRIYPQPSSGSSFIAGEYYVDEQAIKVLEVVPGRRSTPWLKVETPSGKVGYVFGGLARPPGATRSGRRVYGPESSD